jgi:malate dehydrogenase (oxaloacetate-decarboxylating)(NADP+)
VPEIIEETYPFSKLRGGANVLVFPDLTSANTCYKLLGRIGGTETIGPILMGMSKPVHVLQRGAEVEEIVNIAAIAVVDAQETEAPAKPTPDASTKPASREEHTLPLEPLRR